MQKILLPFLLLAATLPAAGQGLGEVRAPLVLYPELQAAWALPHANYAYFSVGGRRAAANFTDFSDGPALSFLNLTAGYEHPWNPRWSWGATLRYAMNSSSYSDVISVVPGLLLRHRASVQGVQFGQRLGVEYALGTAPVNASPFPVSVVSSRALLRLRLDVEELVVLGSRPTGFAIRPRFSFEPALFVRLQRAANDPDKRTIDFTSMRVEVGLRPHPAVELTPWVALQTNYVQTIIFYNSMMQPISDGKLTMLTPVLGLDLRYTFGAAPPDADWHQLPTQN